MSMHAPPPAQVGIIPEWTLGWRLQIALSNRGLTAQQMGEALGVNRATIARWMHDRGAAPKRAYIMQWALITGVNAKWLETGVEPEPDNGGPDGGKVVGRTRRDSNPQPSDPKDGSRHEPAAAIAVVQPRRTAGDGTRAA